MPTIPRTRSTVAAALAVPLLAVLILGGVGAAAELREGARAERVRGMVPFTAAQAVLVHELQRERGLLGLLASGSPPPPGAAGELAATRRAIGGAVAAYRDAAVRIEISDRDRRLHRRLDAGLAQLAGLRTASESARVGDPAGAAAVARRSTDTIAALLGVGGEIGLHEAGFDAGLLRAVTAATAFSRAKELADREQDAAVRSAAGGRVDPAERTRLAAVGGWQDALLDQFATLADPEQRRRSDQAIPAAEAERTGRLRRAVLAGEPAADLAAWSAATTARVEQMRQVELGLNAEVARLAGLADRTADRRALAYGAVALLACAAAVTLLLLVPRRTRRSGATAPGSDARKPRPPLPSPPEGERSPSAEGGLPVVHTPSAESADNLPAGPEALQGLVDLARRGQELLDQQLELLVERDQADPRLPGRLLQLDRLAVRARRNAHNLIVLAGGEPSHRLTGPIPLAEVVALAVRDNPDASRVDRLVAGELLVPGEAAGDLASLLAELVDNATGFSAPETRVRVTGQRVGSGIVLEVEDRGLGMTDDELEGVNRRLAGGPAAGDDPGQRLGAWVAGRLAERHGVKVQLRRSAYGGVAALVFLPESLVTVEPATPGDQPEPAADDAATDRPGEGAALTRLPVRRYMSPEPAPEDEDRPLPKRAPHASLAPDLAAPGDPARPDRPGSRPAARSPEEVRSMLSRYRSGLERGRAAARDLPDDPEDEPPP